MSEVRRGVGFSALTAARLHLTTLAPLAAGTLVISTPATEAVLSVDVPRRQVVLAVLIMLERT